MDLYLHSASTPSWHGVLLKKKAHGRLYLYLTCLQRFPNNFSLLFQVSDVQEATKLLLLLLLLLLHSGEQCPVRGVMVEFVFVFWNI
jgi:hypothetical protein